MARKFLKYLVLLVIAGNLVLITYVFLGRPAPPPRPLPNPNGYDDFVKAGQLITGTPADFKTMNRDELEALVNQNQEALKILQIGLSRDCRVPDDYSHDYIQRHISSQIQLRIASFLLAAEGRLDELDGHTNEALLFYLDCVRFGQKSSQGGVLISRMVGLACETVGRMQLEQFTNTIDGKACREVASALERIDANEESAHASLAQEKLWREKATGFRDKIQGILDFKQEREIRAGFVKHANEGLSQQRHLMVAFAARAYELEKGKQPQKVMDLVPAYLKAVPKDPVTGKDLGLTH